MTDDIWKRGEIASPCQKICVIHPEARICVGCNRTSAEIARWTRMTPAERDAIIKELPARTRLLVRRRGGRAGRQENNP